MKSKIIAGDALICIVVAGSQLFQPDFPKTLFLLLFWFGFRVFFFLGEKKVFWISLPSLFFLNPESLLIFGTMYGLYGLFYSLIQSLAKEKVLLQQENLTKDVTLKRMQERLSRGEELRLAQENNLRLEERDHLSQQLHDTVGHTMTGVLLQVEAARWLMHKDEEKAASLLESSASNMRHGIQEIRQVLRASKPSTETMGLTKLKNLVAETQRTASISVDLKTQGDLSRIPLNYFYVLYFNAQEALTNILRYSRAHKVMVHLSVFYRLVRLEVSDDGVGSKEVRKGLGILGMEERAAEHGGKVAVSGDHGFRVITTLPLHPQEEGGNNDTNRNH